ncbi:MAG: MmcQ/YjbR family DNA-binding protein [Clostridia bacterium]|nr:MmcQ/YjbR family DNA-binding protein [Clostridia bacterium]
MKLNLDKLMSFGFEKRGGVFVFSKFIGDNQLEMTVSVQENGELNTKVVDDAFGYEYTLHLVDSAVGSFVGQVRKEYSELLTKIYTTCYDKEYHKYPQTQEIVDAVYEKYGVLPEHPFEDDNETAVFRRKDNQKWFFIKMNVPPQKIGLDGTDLLEVINLKIDPEELNMIVDNENYFRAYHMNKKMWATLVLDGRLSTQEVLKRIDDSYNLVATKKKGRLK